MANKLLLKTLVSLVIMSGWASVTAQPVTWDVIEERSFISFSGTQTGNPFEGQFSVFDVEIEYSPTEPESARVLATIETKSAVTGDSQRDDALPGKDWFNVAAFPNITFSTDGFQQNGVDNFVANGVLTVLGVEHELSLPFALTLADNVAIMDSSVVLNRQLLGIGSGPWSEGKWVGLDVTVKIHIEATRGQP